MSKTLRIETKNGSKRFLALMRAAQLNGTYNHITVDGDSSGIIRCKVVDAKKGERGHTIFIMEEIPLANIGLAS